MRSMWMGRDWRKFQESKYLGCVLDESGTDVAKCRRRVTSGKKVSVAIRSLINTKSAASVCEAAT